MLNEYKEEYERWLSQATEDADLIEELKGMVDADVEDAFYQELKFGTGGLRGIIGAGTNRMNIYTVGKASKGVADYICDTFSADERKIAIAYDTRRKSHLFAERAAGIFAANGIEVYMYDEAMPTPALSFAIRALGCAAGVVVTASHNPAEYNGYKVYGADGCQITNDAAKAIYAKIQAVDVFAVDTDASGKADIHKIGEDVIDAYIKEACDASMIVPIEGVDANVTVVYTPLHGTGCMPVKRALHDVGFTNIITVKEQEEPDGQFPTCPKPNPEEPSAMEMGLAYCEKYRADLLIATDPDCDRVAIALPEKDGTYRLMNTNEVGVLLLDFICSGTERDALAGKVFMKTIVTTDMAEIVASHYGLSTVNTLTGFKYIGEQIGELEAKGEEDRFLYGFEESCGYLSGSYVRDKDGVNAAVLITDMAAYYKAKNKTLLEKLDELYDSFGYCLNLQKSYIFKGKDGQEKMAALIESFREERADLAGIGITDCKDYAKGVDGLPKSNVLKFFMEGGSTVTIRPSGTEPKLKIYFSLVASDKNAADQMKDALIGELEKVIGQ